MDESRNRHRRRMRRHVRAIRQQVRRARAAERFVQLVCGGGVALVTGLWIVTLSRPRSVPWLVGVVAVVLGVAGLAGGIYRGIDTTRG